MGTIAEMLERRGAEKVEKAFIQEKAKLAAEYEQRGKLEAVQEMLIKALRLKFDFVKPHVIQNIKAVQSLDVLENLFELSFKCSTIKDFTKYLNQAAEE